MNPAMGGRKNVQARRIIVNLQPSIPTSIGNRLNAHRDHPVRNATMVPILAPECRSPATIGKLTKGPPGVKPPATVPMTIPLIPDSTPTHLDTTSLGRRAWIIPAMIKAQINNGSIPTVMVNADFIPRTCCPCPLKYPIRRSVTARAAIMTVGINMEEVLLFLFSLSFPLDRVIRSPKVTDLI